MADRVVDLGNLPLSMDDAPGNRALIRETYSTIFARGAAPFALGGDDSIPLPMLWALETLGDLTIVQVDTHQDWRDDGGGERHGLSSGMRRASELPFVKAIIQVGMRGLSSAARSDVDDAKAWGVNFFPARAVHTGGVAPIPEHIEPDANVFLTIDLDGLDPSIMPAVSVPAPGGLLYWQMIKLIEGSRPRRAFMRFSLSSWCPTAIPRVSVP